MRIVLDTNVLIAAFISRGVCAELFEHVALHHEWVCSDYILREFASNLRRKFRYTPREIAAARSLIIERAILVEPAAVKRGACRDADDLPILGTALAGSCDCLITGDDDLLVLESYETVRIVSPADFWRFEHRRG